MAALSNVATPSEPKSQSLISKVSVSLQLQLEVTVAIETVFWNVRLGLRIHTGWSNLRNKLFITLFEQKKQHLWQLLSDFIGDFKYEI